MTDLQQHALHAAALGSPALGTVAEFWADVLLFILAALLRLHLKTLSPALWRCPCCWQPC